MCICRNPSPCGRKGSKDINQSKSGNETIGQMPEDLNTERSIAAGFELSKADSFDFSIEFILVKTWARSEP